MNYSENVHKIILGDKQVFLIGTAHISQSSVDEVKLLIENENPDTVLVELCNSRYQAMMDKDKWKNMDIFKVVREGKSFLLFANLIMTAFQKRLGSKIGVKPGAEMFEAVKISERLGAELLLADRDVKTTLQRTWRSISFFGKIKVIEKGQLLPNYEEIEVAEYMRGQKIDLTVDLNIGNKNFTAYTMDLTKKYIEINADYRS